MLQNTTPLNTIWLIRYGSLYSFSPWWRRQFFKSRHFPIFIVNYKSHHDQLSFIPVVFQTKYKWVHLLYSWHINNKVKSSMSTDITIGALSKSQVCKMSLMIPFMHSNIALDIGFLITVPLCVILYSSHIYWMWSLNFLPLS